MLRFVVKQNAIQAPKRTGHGEVGRFAQAVYLRDARYCVFGIPFMFAATSSLRKLTYLPAAAICDYVNKASRFHFRGNVLSACGASRCRVGVGGVNLRGSVKEVTS